MTQYEGIKSIGGNFNYFDVQKKVSRTATVLGSSLWPRSSMAYHARQQSADAVYLGQLPCCAAEVPAIRT